MIAKYKAPGWSNGFPAKTGRQSWWVQIQSKKGGMEWGKDSEAGALGGLDVPKSDLAGIRLPQTFSALFPFWWNSDVRTDPRLMQRVG
jgi:hypothetical protein